MAAKKLEQPKRGRGRPRGSRNKPKGEAVQRAESLPAPLARVAARADDAPVGSIEYHEAQRAKLQALFDALLVSEVPALPKDYAALDAGIARHSKAIAELRGEVRLTVSKIVKSELFITWFAGLLESIRDEPKAVEKIVAYLERTSG